METITRKTIKELIKILEHEIALKDKCYITAVHANCIPQYGGWEIKFTLRNGNNYDVTALRLTNKEAYWMLRGILFSIIMS